MTDKRRAQSARERPPGKLSSAKGGQKKAAQTSRVEQRRQQEFAMANRILVPGKRKNTEDNLRQTAGGAKSRPGRRTK